eukprot:scaffold16843_cov51-Cyclotella_meneghiniana.AAC.2
MELRKIAPELRTKHLRQCLITAIENGDEEAIQEITRIRRKECDRKRRMNIAKYVKPNQGRMVMAVQVDENGTSVRYDSHEDVVRVVNSRIGQRYKLGLRSPLSMGQLAEDIGQYAEKEAAQRILDGTYEFPEGTDEALVELLKEAARIRVAFDTSDTEPDYVTVEDFISYWKSAREKTSSSDSGRHFGHYIAASDDPELAILHVESLNIAARRGTALDRWKSALTVLLEKVMGNILIEKLRAICLLEADFNWWLKMTFARKMMSDIRRQDMIPMEQVATAGKATIDGTLMKQIDFFDKANTLHIIAGMDSVDAEQCYDAVNHAATSLGMQAYGMSLEQICLYLETMANMIYHLKTAFERDEQGFSGAMIPYDPDGRALVPARPSLSYFNGLGQGSGGAPPAWQVVSSLMIGAYKRRGFGVWSRTAWSGLVYTIAAILFVDDCDLLHMLRDRSMSEEEFLRRKQKALRLWARLLQVTGGDLKPAKCFWYLLSYKFVNGVARLRRLSELPQYVMFVPQHDGTEQPIQLIDVKVAKQTLGVFTKYDSTPLPKTAKDRRTEHLKYMVDKRVTWQKRIAGSKLSTRDRWFSFSTQTKLSIQYGIEAIMDPPDVVTNAFQALYFMTLPHLGVNRYITLGWRMLPHRYQGLGLPNFALEKLGRSVSWLQRHWGVKEWIGVIIRAGFERLQVETGLSGNILLLDYDRYECLATHTWFKILWQYLSTFKVRLEIAGVDVPATRERDRVIMDEVTQVMDRSEWPAVNRVRKHLELFFLSQASHCDGVCLREEVISGRIASQSLMEFPYEEPTASDRRLWRKALILITSPNFRIPIPLGKFVRQPYDRVVWKTDEQRQWLLRTDQQTKQSKLFVVSANARPTRQGVKYIASEDVTVSPASPTLYASVQSHPDESVTLHSVAPLEYDETDDADAAPTLREVIGKYPNQSLWDHLDLGDDGGNWILDAIRMGTLVGVHDGSYKDKLCARTCSAGVVLFCTQQRRLATAACAERTDSRTASSYRGELLGGLLMSLILKAASSLIGDEKCPPVRLACDNIGAVGHGNNRGKSLKDAQVQADVIRCFRAILADISFDITYEHVLGHQDDKVAWAALTLVQQLNVVADKVAQDYLVRAIHSFEPYTPGGLFLPTFPSKAFV